ncbi:sensor histidine kinase [Actinomadura algeriensis]|uniref:histidine kinase n=1 Tax=Actinomadura algeriensis TaxID=1679523 RepID=A0ABR9JL04_9ACTN|nr:sensor histidine kinase [Actinomadura algeriensis]MBE1531134.1 signal transduction histidine kinase [Actinomadura algeriensis]
MSGLTTAPGGAAAGGGAGSGGSVARASWRPQDMARSSLTWRSAAYQLFSLTFGAAWFVFLVTGVSLSLGLLIIWVGAPLAALLLLLWRGGAVLERQLMRGAFGVTIPSPYRPMPEGHLLKKLKGMVADPATWKDFAYFALLFPVALVEFTVSVTIWATAGIFLAAPVVVLLGEDMRVQFGLVSYDPQNPFDALLGFAAGCAAFVLAMYVTRVLAIGHALYATFLLGPNASQLEARRQRARADRLQASRARGVDAAESERRRIERDLHDGAQQRLLAVAMDIGRARAKLEDDPEGARALIEQAHTGTKEAISELRDLARGIYPAILTDRGLDPALSGLAGRAPVPVDVQVDLPERPPAAVESIAYFIVAESLANIAKYARATRASVRVEREDAWVVVEIIDNGVGGAVAAPDGGLAGLADRAATIDGMLIVDSPPGGPTIIRADLPCTW